MQKVPPRISVEIFPFFTFHADPGSCLDMNLNFETTNTFHMLRFKDASAPNFNNLESINSYQKRE
jgi:hypothetical protein